MAPVIKQTKAKKAAIRDLYALRERQQFFSTAERYVRTERQNGRMLSGRYDIYDAISADDVDTPTSSRHPSGSTRTDEGEAGPVDEATDANSSRDETLLNVNVKVTDVETSSAVQSRATVPSLSGDGRSVIEIEDSDSDEDFVPKSVAKVAIKGQSKKKTNVKKVNKSKPKIAKKIIKKGTAKKVIKKKAVKKNANRVSKKNVNRRNK